MSNKVLTFILKATGAKSAFPIGVVQRLWSGYGEIVRYGLTNCDRDSVIVKHVKLSGRQRTNAGSISHQRKLRSYQVETAWYEQWSKLCNADCRIPACLAAKSLDDEVLILLEDLDAAGFRQRRSAASIDEIHACLSWLANFHATFIGIKPDGLWPTGTYWHLATRPEELQALDDLELKTAASAIDLKLKASPYQTLVHGDAKLANFCFSDDGKVAAVDFQYVGGGCGIKDVAYFIDSCLDGDKAEKMSDGLLDCYFRALKQALQVKNPTFDADAIERDWRALYPVAWTDFHRFLKGWSPSYWPAGSYSERLARQVIAEL
ncbi:MAG: phosphotransferase [Methylobacter sp.]